jgi:hypothetical protein
MQAVDPITMGQFGSWNAEKMQVAEGNVITYDADTSWIGGDVWLGQDLSAYEYVCIVLEDCQGNFKFTLEYEKIAGDENNVSQEYQFSTGTKQVTFKLDPARKQKVTKIMLQNTSNGGTLDVGNLYAGSAAEFETALDLGNLNTGWNTEYEVRLSNSTKLEFNQHGDIRQVDCEYGFVPESILLTPIKSYLKKHFPNTNVTEYHVERKVIKVELNTGLELIFNAQGGFLRMDD